MRWLGLSAYISWRKIAKNGRRQATRAYGVQFDLLILG